ncbi:MAG: hypothetical protein M1812_002403 [Candelaria pacifica]|nr:MAG: hypothetical protein M1812_002403 [Candelaria pacifica]
MAGLFSSQKIPFSIADLSKSDISLLTQILSLPPSANKGTLTRRQTTQASSTLVSSLPKHLRAPIPYQHRIVTFISKHVPSMPPSTLAPLCPTHSTMNTQLIHSIFTCLALEVGIRLNTLTVHMHLYPEQETFIHSLRELHSLWLAPEVYKRTFLESPPAKWSYETSRCEACMLARIGGDADMICKLKVALVSRLRSNHREPLLVRWVDGWLDWVNEGGSFLQGAERKVKIEEEAKTFRNVRRTAQRAKKGKIPKVKSEKNKNPFDDDKQLKSGKGKNPFDDDKHDKDPKIKSEKNKNPFEDDKHNKEPIQDQEIEAPDEIPEPTGADFEHSIIDHYAALMSTTHLPIQADGSRWQFSGARRPEDEGHVHPAFRNRPETPSRRESTRTVTRGASPRHEAPRRQESTGTVARGAAPRHEDPRRQESTRTVTRGAAPRHEDPRRQESTRTVTRGAAPRHEDPRHKAPRRQESTRTVTRGLPPRHEDPRRQESTRTVSKGAGTQAQEYQALLPNRDRTATRARENPSRGRDSDLRTMTSWGDMYKN